MQITPSHPSATDYVGRYLVTPQLFLAFRATRGGGVGGVGRSSHSGRASSPAVAYKRPLMEGHQLALGELAACSSRVPVSPFFVHLQRSAFARERQIIERAGGNHSFQP